MLEVNFSNQALKFIQGIPLKHKLQILERINRLAQFPEEMPIKILKGYSPFCRLAAGEYRVVFKIVETELFITIIEKRNDDEIYKMLKRLM